MSVIDDDPGVRDSLAWLLRSVGLTVDAYERARDFLATYDPDRPGCLVVDVRLPGMSGLELLNTLRNRDCTLPAIVVTAFGDVRSTVRAMRGGAIDVLEKPVDDQLLIERVQQAIDLDRRTRAARYLRRAAAESFATLSPREKQVFGFVTDGKPNKWIGAELGVSTKTVEGYRAALMRKLEAHSVPDLMRIKLLVDDDPDTGESR